jgi:CRP-like cAMP-binding protein
MKRLDELVGQSPIVVGLNQRHLDLIVGCGENVAFQPGAYIFREGDPADTFYLLRHGRVLLETFIPGRGALTIETIDEGDVLGWSWLFSPYRWHYDARTLETVRAIAFDGTCLRGKCDADPVFGYELLRRFAPVMLERLQATRLRLIDMYGRAA